MGQRIVAICALISLFAACGRSGAATTAVESSPVASFDEPWALAFLPDGRVLVTEKKGTLKLLAIGGAAREIRGVPSVAYGGQGGLGDVALDPDFAKNRRIYLSYAEPGADGTRGAAVAQADLALEPGGGGELAKLAVIWRQVPKVAGHGHYGHRIRFGPDRKLWISSGERQKFDPSQDMSSNLGKIVRLEPDGAAAADNPFAKQGGVAAQVWTLGHRNPLGIAFDERGRLWEVEMGPRGGDELNRIERGRNYGYPIVSNGDHYDGRTIPDHDTRPEFAAPAIAWTPVINPAALIFYTGSGFPAWRGQALIASLGAGGLVRVAIDGDRAREVERVALGRRIRSVAQSPDGALYVLEDGPGGRLLKLTAAR